MKIRCSFNVYGFVKENMDENFFLFLDDKNFQIEIN